MKNLILAIIWLPLLAACQPQGQAPIEPVNKNASPEAKALLKYLYSISGEKIISGHHNGSRDMDRWHKYVEDLTGKSPAIWGSDFINYYREGNPERVIEQAIQRHRDGYIVTLMWHTGRPQDDPPFDWATSTQGEVSDHEWKELTTPGSALHSKWVSRVDSIAGYLKQLRDLYNYSGPFLMGRLKWITGCQITINDF